MFPYGDARFNCAVAYSVFTHLQFEETCNYLRETYRILRPGGRLVATFFLLNDQSEAAQKAIREVEQFPYESGPIRRARGSNPAFAVAIKQSVLRELLRDIGFKDVAIEAGGWYGVQNTPAFQDLVICLK